MFTIEPMINEGSASDELWPDNWTAVTRDGKRSAQFEHTLLITEEGVEVLTARKGSSRNKLAPWEEAGFRRPDLAAVAVAVVQAAAAGAAAVPVGSAADAIAT